MRQILFYECEFHLQNYRRFIVQNSKFVATDSKLKTVKCISLFSDKIAVKYIQLYFIKASTCGGTEVIKASLYNKYSLLNFSY